MPEKTKAQLLEMIARRDDDILALEERLQRAADQSEEMMNSLVKAERDLLETQSQHKKVLSEFQVKVAWQEKELATFQSEVLILRPEWQSCGGSTSSPSEHLPRAQKTSPVNSKSPIARAFSFIIDSGLISLQYTQIPHVLLYIGK